MSLAQSKNNKFIALIPARLNSKGLSKKNIKKINGKSLLEYTIEAALKSKLLDSIYLNSESTQILNIGKKHDINLFLRNKNLSKDNTEASDIVYDFLKKIKKEISLDNFFIVYLQPTSPLRNSNHIDKAIKLLKKTKADSLMSGCKYSNNVLKSFFVDKHSFIKLLTKKSYLNSNRQNLPNVFKSNGAIYIVKAKNFFLNKKFISNKTIFFEMSKRNSLDIDNKYDFNLFKKLI